MKKFLKENDLNLVVKRDYPLAKLTTFKIGGAAKFYCEPRTIDQLIASIKFAFLKNISFFILGGGSNVLISDNGFSGLVINTRKLNKIYKIEESLVVAMAGVTVKNLNRFLLKESLSGLEFSSGLPGTVGGAVYMNARAYGREFADVVEEVTVLTADCSVKKLKKDELNYSYKDSIFMKENLIIFDVKLRLAKSRKIEIKKKYLENLLDRKNKGQYKYPSAGCVFKNDYNNNIICGKLLDQMGLKGLSVGGAMVPDFHANFIVNYKRAKAKDVKKLIETIEDKVKKEKGIKLEREVRFVGF